jgi:hypothetical protein
VARGPRLPTQNVQLLALDDAQRLRRVIEGEPHEGRGDGVRRDRRIPTRFSDDREQGTADRQRDALEGAVVGASALVIDEGRAQGSELRKPEPSASSASPFVFR